MDTLSKSKRLDRKFETDLTVKTKNLMSRLSKDLVNVREAFGLNQAELVRRCRIDQPALSKIEGGNIENVELKTLVRLAMGLGLQLNISLTPINAPNKGN